MLLFNHIRDLRRIRKNLSLDLAKKIAVALVSSGPKLDYCKSLSHNMPEKDIARLQRIQNCFAKVVTKASCQVKSRIHFKIYRYRVHNNFPTLAP